MDELGRKLAETQDKKIIEELYELALKLEKMRQSVDLFMHREDPRLLELAILPKQPFKLLLHFHIVCLVKLPRQRVRSHPEKFSNSVANPGEGSAKHLLLAFEINLVGSVMVQDVIAVLRD